MAQRRHRKNPLPVSALVQWIGVATVCGIVGFFYVYLKVQMVSKGREIKTLDAHTTELKQGNDILRSQIDHFTSREYLLKQSAAGFIQLEPISEDRLVRLAEMKDVDGLAQVSDLPGEVQVAYP